MKTKLFILILITLGLDTNLHSQVITGDNNIPFNFVTDYIYSPAALNNDSIGTFEVSFSPEIDNIWVKAKGNKTGENFLLNPNESSSSSWGNLNSEINYFITDSINPYSTNIDHSITFHFPEGYISSAMPVLGDFRLSLALGDTFKIILNSISYPEYVEFNSLSIFKTEVSNEDGTNYEEYSVQFMEGDFTDIFKTGSGGRYLRLIFAETSQLHNDNAFWSFGNYGNINEITFTLISGQNNINNSGVAFSGLHMLDVQYNTTSIYNIDENYKQIINLYPNPFNETLNIENNLNIDLIEITDLTGKRLVQFINTNNVTQLNLSDLKSGIYLVRFYKGSEIIKTEKVIKQ